VAKLHRFEIALAIKQTVQLHNLHHGDSQTELRTKPFVSILPMAQFHDSIMNFLFPQCD